MRHLTIALLALAFLLSTHVAETKEPGDVAAPAGPYFGQKPPGEKAALFAPGIVSVGGRFEYALSISPDGREILFSAEEPDRPSTLHHSRLGEDGWSVPRKVSLSGGMKKAEMEAFFTPDGKRIYFAAYDEGMDVRIWAVERVGGEWRRPREIGPPLADGPAFFPTTTADGTIYYTNLATRRVFRAVMSGDAVRKAEDAGLGAGMHAFVTPDESLALVDARQEEDGTSDILVAFRRGDGSWAAPVRLGPEVNTDYDETCPSLSHDGKYLFFSRYNEENERSNIYWISSAVISEARARARDAQ